MAELKIMENKKLGFIGGGRITRIILQAFRNKNMDFDSEVYIYNERVAFVSFDQDNLRGLIVKDKSMFEMQKMMFEKLWEVAEE